MQSAAERWDAVAGSAWNLSLGLEAQGRLRACLSDSAWLSVEALAVWPPQGRTGLPAPIVEALTQHLPLRLRLQLPLALDAWPWEQELRECLGRALCLPRYLIDLPPASPDAGQRSLGAGLPLCLPAAGASAALRSARQAARPLVLVDAEASQETLRRLDAVLRRRWRGDTALSEALELSLLELQLPFERCRLYGDGLSPASGPEQGRRPVTALSIDLVRSTPLLQAGDETYARRLQAYHSLCRDVIEKLEGYVDPPRGNDGLMAYFGFPVAVEASAARALSAAWQLAQGVAELGLQVRIGVASGNVAVSARQAFGAEVHLAARLRELARPGEVLVSASTRERVGAGFSLQAVQLNEPVKDYPYEKAVWRLDAAPAEALQGRASRAGPFVGREPELAQLRAAWALARTGQPQWCCVEGEPGIGKSRLLQEFVRELQSQGWSCLEIVGQPHGASSPYAAVLDGLRRHLGSSEGRQIERLLPDIGHSSVDVSGAHWREQLLERLLALGTDGPLCLVIDDAHWLDPSSVELLRRLHLAAQDRPLLVVSGERSDAARIASLSGSTPLQLQGLDSSAAALMASALGAHLPERTRRRIVERAEGLPLYLEEELLRLRDQPQSDEAEGLPSSLEDLLMVRLDALGPDRGLAQLMSVLGRECSELELQALLEQSDAFVDLARRQGSLASLLGSGLVQLIEGAPPRYRFKHALIRDAAYASIWSHDRQRLHGLCADLIELHMPELARQRPEQLAEHLAAAGRTERACQAWAAAAQLAAARQAHAETLVLAGRMLERQGALKPGVQAQRAAVQMQLLIAAAQIALQGYGSAEVETAYLAAEQASAELADPRLALRTRLGLEACYVMRGDLVRAAGLADSVAASVDPVEEPRLALQARWAQANVCFHRGDWQRALAGFDACLALYEGERGRRPGVQDPAVMCLGYAAWVHFELGQADLAWQRLEHMLALAQALEHPYSLGVAHGFAASVKRLCGDSAAAWPHALEALRICERGDFHVWLAHARMVRGQLRADRGDLAGGEADMLRGYGEWFGSGARISCATYLCTRAEILLRQHRNQEAAGELGAAWLISETIGEHYYQAELLRLQGLQLWQAGALSQAAEQLDQAWARAESSGRRGLALRCALSRGALDASTGQHEAAQHRVQQALLGLEQHRSSRDWRWAVQACEAWSAGRHFEHLEHTPWEPR